MGPSPVAIFAAGSGRQRFASGLLAAALQAGLVLLLLYGLAATSLPPGVRLALTSLDLRTPPPPPPAPRPATHRTGAAAPPAPRAQAAAVVAPRVVPLDPPPLFPVAPVAGQGTQPSAGAATAGQGSGAGGQGNGSGAGGGDGDGGGASAELVSGRIRPSDTPGHLFTAPFAGTTDALVQIDAVGKVTDCRTRRSSGNATLDALTCHLITTRFHFRPAHDAAGRPIAGKIIYEHDWEVGGGFDNDPPG